MRWRNIDDLAAALANLGYIGHLEICTALKLALHLQKPLLLEGEAGAGKTETAKALAQLLQTSLIRLQCYEGLDVHNAIYEWNYSRQLLAIKAREKEQTSAEEIEAHIFSQKYLLARPLLQAIQQSQSPVLLIDEIDRADIEFEAYLLELLSDFQISIPEFGTIRAKSIPYVILTSNGTRELSDALRRRCLYCYLEYPEMAREIAILQKHFPDLEEHFAHEIVGFVQNLRAETLEKKPGIAETLDWCAGLLGLGVTDLRKDPVAIHDSLLCLLKTRNDLLAIAPQISERLAGKTGAPAKADGR